MSVCQSIYSIYRERKKEREKGRKREVAFFFALAEGESVAKLQQIQRGDTPPTFSPGPRHQKTLVSNRDSTYGSLSSGRTSPSNMSIISNTLSTLSLALGSSASSTAKVKKDHPDVLPMVFRVNIRAEMLDKVDRDEPDRALLIISMLVSSLKHISFFMPYCITKYMADTARIQFSNFLPVLCVECVRHSPSKLLLLKGHLCHSDTYAREDFIDSSKISNSHHRAANQCR